MELISQSAATVANFRAFNKQQRKALLPLTSTEDANGIDCARMFMLQKYGARNPMADPFSTLAKPGSYLQYCYTIVLHDKQSLAAVVGLSSELKRLGYCTVSEYPKFGSYAFVKHAPSDFCLTLKHPSSEAYHVVLEVPSEHLPTGLYRSLACEQACFHCFTAVLLSSN